LYHDFRSSDIISRTDKSDYNYRLRLGDTYCMIMVLTVM